jgi:predicted nucleotidyltransferase
VAFSATLDQKEAVGKNKPWTREKVINTLRAHERELKEAGIVHLSLFGSTARGDGGTKSDVDLLV